MDSLLVVWYLLIVLIILVVSLFVIIPSLRGASFETSNLKAVAAMIRLSRIKKGERVAELGSGDGKVAIAFGRTGAFVDGYEINPILVLWSRWQIKKAGLDKNVRVYWKSFWNIDLKNYDIVSMFQIHYIMKKLERKLKKELRGDCRIISNKWEFPNLQYRKRKNNIYLYVLNKQS